MADKDGVRFVNNTEEVIKTMQGLSKTALRESGKVVRKILRERLPVRSKRIKNHIATWVFVERSTGQPQMQVGLYSWQKVVKRHKLPSHSSPHWIEFGTAPHTIAAKNAKVMAYDEDVYGKVVQHPGQRDRHVLRSAVYDNIAEIREAQAKYLKALSGEIDKAKGLIVESEEPEDD
jgi:hypothetical protein